MKKLLALLLVGAALTATAATPKVHISGQAQPNKALVMKANTLTNQLSAPVMKADKKVMSPQRFFAENNVTPNDNKLIKKAPRRVTEADVLSDKITFMLAYEFNSDSNTLEFAGDYCQGGWMTQFEKASDGVYNAYVYFVSIPFVFNLDLEAKTGEMVMENLFNQHWIDTVRSGQTTYYYDTTQYVFLASENYLFSDAEEDSNLPVTVYDDGTLYIPDGWAVYSIDITKTTRLRNGTVQSETTDTAGVLWTDIMRGTYLMAPTGTHSYTAQSSGTSYSNEVYMYQSDDTTVNVWNLWQFGYRGMELKIYEDGTMFFAPQCVGTEGIDDLVAAYPNYDWSEGYEFWNLDSVYGTVDNTSIKWDETTWRRWAALGSDWYTLSYYPMINNVLTFTVDDKFLLGNAAAPQIVVTEGDDAYTFTGVSTDGADVYLFLFDPTTGQLTEMIENPYTVVRTEEDQVVYIAAIADGYNIGKNLSEVVGDEYTVPALAAAYELGDVNTDGVVNITDVTMLINAVLNDNYSTINADKADMNNDGIINVTDVTMLITKVQNS